MEESFGFCGALGDVAHVAGGPPHTHSEVQINLALDEEVTYVFPDHRVTLRPGRLTVFDGRHPHHAAPTRAKGACLWVNIPWDVFRDFALPATLLQALSRGLVLEEPSSVIESCDRFYVTDWVKTIEGEGAKNALAASGAALMVQAELRGRLHRLAWTTGWGRKPKTSVASSSERTENIRLLHQIENYITQNLEESLTVDRIAEACATNPKRIKHLARTAWGHGVYSHLTRRRLEKARHLIETTHDKILNIALACGYQNLSAFYRAFALHYGCQPGSLRRPEGTSPHRT
jgi:AraC-like DNA-binding protein